MLEIKQCSGEGLGSCKMCSDNGNWNRNWMCFLYRINGYEGVYCKECVDKITAKINISRNNDSE